jgi:mono/diheme cytochrome c family protein
MPPFAGTDAERAALARFLVTLHQASPVEHAEDGKAVFQRICGVCHQIQPTDALFQGLRAMNPAAAAEALKDLPGLFVRMPDLKLTQEERGQLVGWANAQFSGKK